MTCIQIKMAALMFQDTPRIAKAVQFINAIDQSRFPLLLTRIIHKLHLKDERTFSEEEEERLQKAFGLTSDDLDLVVETLEFFLQQAAYHTSKPALLSQQLLTLNISEEKVSAIVEVWTENAKDVVAKLRQRTICPKQLDTINWRLNLQMAQSSKTKMKLPNAMFELGLTDENSSSTKKEKIQMEFTHDELYQFYNQLETIQSQLDNLT